MTTLDDNTLFDTLLAPNMLDGIHHINITLLDEVGAIIYVNRPWTRFAHDNGAKNDFLGSNYIDVCDNSTGMYSSEAPLVSHNLRLILAGEKDRFELSYPCHSPTEERWFEMHVNSMILHEKTYVTIAHRNITERKRVEVAKERATRLIFHDIRNPLTAVSMVSGQMQELLHGDIGENFIEQFFNSMTMLQKNIERAWEIVNSNSILTKIEQGAYCLNVEKVIINHLLDDTVKAMAVIFPHIELRMVLDDAVNGALFSCEPRLFKTVLENLLINALNAADGRPVTLKALMDGACFLFDIHNFGVIKESVRDNFFDKYVTSDKHRGTGLGTYSAKLVVEAHHGEIKFTTSQEEGTNLLVRIPANLA